MLRRRAGRAEDAEGVALFERAVRRRDAANRAAEAARRRRGGGGGGGAIGVRRRTNAGAVEVGY